MSVEIDGKELGNFIERGGSWMGGREYRGKGLEDEGKMLEAWLKERSKGMNVRVKDNKFPKMRESVVLQIAEITHEWKGNILYFRIVFKEL